MKIVVTGHARHGKDTVCKMLAEILDVKWQSSSMVAAEKVVFPALKGPYGYDTVEECFEDRVNHRKEWFDLIVDYNTPDLARLGRDIFEQSSIYCGLRNIHELNALRAAGLVDLVIWVDASGRCESESNDSCTIVMEDCEWTVYNDGTLDELRSVMVDVAAAIHEGRHLD